MNRRTIDQLQHLVDRAMAVAGNGKANQRKEQKYWQSVLDYLQEHCEPRHDNPRDFPDHYAASVSLQQELWYDSVTGESLFRYLLSCCANVPLEIGQVILQLCPMVLQATDEQGLLPLHYACRYPPSPCLDEWMQRLVIPSYPQGLVQRTRIGHTPVHYLLIFHGKERSKELVQAFLQCGDDSTTTGRSSSNADLGEGEEDLPTTRIVHHADNNENKNDDDDNDELYPLPTQNNKTSASSPATVFCHLHGGLPLHYAIMHGTSLQTIQLLLEAYPASKHCTDRYGRTPLHCYLGAGALTLNGSLPAHSRYNTDTSDTTTTDQHPSSWHTHPLNATLVQLLSSSRVARTADATGRHPLHWACAYLAHQMVLLSSASSGAAALPWSILQAVYNPFVGQITCQDEYKQQTPLMVLLDTALRLRQQPQSLELLTLDTWKLLLEHPDGTANVAALEDVDGKLPLHVWLQLGLFYHAAGATFLHDLLDLHPAAVLHVTEHEGRVPLHCAFLQPYPQPSISSGTTTQQQQQQLQAVQTLLQSHAANKHVQIQGKLALKMEDAAGQYALHYACQAPHTSLELLQVLLHAHPPGALVSGPAGDLPVHCLLTAENVRLAATAAATSRSDTNGTLAERSKEQHDQEVLSIVRDKMALLLRPLTVDPSRLQMADSVFGMLPLHIAVLFQAMPYSFLLRMLELYPLSALQFSKKYSVLDCHDLQMPAAATASFSQTQDWQRIRELLFSFGPTLGSHRHRQGLLRQCVRVVVDELNGFNTFHLNPEPVPDVDLTHTVSNMEADAIVMMEGENESPTTATDNNASVRTSPNAAARARLPKKWKKHSSKKKEPALPKPQQRMENDDIVPNSSSIYDDEDTGLDYVVSDPESDDSSSSSDEGRSEDEYLSEEYDEDEDDDDDTEVHQNASIQGEDEFFYPVNKAGRPSLEGKDDISAQDETDPFQEMMEKSRKEEEQRAHDETAAAAAYQRPRFISEVALRLWTFFVLYCDPQNPNDNYAQQVSEILDEIEFSTAQKLALLPLPPFSTLYTGDSFARGMTFRDAASPKCRELIHKICYFLGKYEFDTGEDILIRRTNHSVLVRAYEWIFTTEGVTDAINPGMSEEQIWSTGEVPAQIGATFDSWRRPVWIKFTKNMSEYRNNIDSRVKTGVPLEGKSRGYNGVTPLVAHYNATGTERKMDRIYKIDTGDDRFKSLLLYGRRTRTMGGKKQIVLKEYPFALVYPVATHGSLLEYVKECNVLCMEEIKEICRGVGRGLSHLHSKGVIHGNVAMDNIYLCGGSDGMGDSHWSLGDLSHARTTEGPPKYMGVIDSEGIAQFEAASLPPEMFAKLSPRELNAYNAYWTAVENTFKIQVDRAAIEPMVDLESGAVFVVKCYFVPGISLSTTRKSLPPLPYKLVDRDTKIDIWAFGRLIFALCSGRDLFGAARDGRLSNLEKLNKWSHELADYTLSEYIENPLAQDILLSLLSSRLETSLDGVLSHPFFSTTKSTSPASTRIAEARKRDSAASKRHLQKKMRDEFYKAWLERRCMSINIWDFDLLERFHLSPTEIIRSTTVDKCDSRSPSSFFLLPYRFGAFEATHENVAEMLGFRLLSLSKACAYTLKVREWLKAQHSTNSADRSAAHLLGNISLPVEHFADIQASVNELGSKHVELFRHDPLAITMKMLQLKISQVFKCFEGRPIFLTPFDEFSCMPVENGLYPMQVPESYRSAVLENCLLTAHLCCLYSRAVHSNLTGLGKIIYPRSASMKIPQSWEATSRGLSNVMDSASFLREINLLEDALTTMCSTKHRIGTDDARVIGDFIDAVDPKRQLAGMKRVTASGASLWTTEEGANALQEMAESVSFQNALNMYRRNQIV